MGKGKYNQIRKLELGRKIV